MFREVIKRFSKYLAIWLVGQTLVMGLIVWLGMYRVLVQGDEFTYKPAPEPTPVAQVITRRGK